MAKNVYLDEETHELVKRIAEREHRSIATVIRLALAAYVKGAAK